MTEQALPPLPAIGSAVVQILSAGETAHRWGFAQWDVSKWDEVAWRDVTPETMHMQVSWGADDAAGVLTAPAAGQWTLDTYDPDRRLDPSNGASPFSAALRPGRPIRLLYRSVGFPDETVRKGLIDEIEFDVIARTGRIRGTDGIGLMVQAVLLAGLSSDAGMPTTLRARARYLIAKAKLSNLITVEDDPMQGDPPVPFDPVIGAVIDDDANLWAHLSQYARDVLYAVWLDRHGMLRFRGYGDPRDSGLQAGGEGGIPLSSLNTQSSLGNVYTHVIAFDVAAPTVPVEKEEARVEELYGDIIYKRDRPVPNAVGWVDSVLADRAGASLQYAPGTLYPQTRDHLMSILDTGMVDILNIVAEADGINIAARVLGGFIRADTGTGWSATFGSYIPAKEWEQAETPPPTEPPVEPPPDTHQETRTYAATKDTRAARTDGGSNYGSGTEGELPVGAWQGWRNRAFIDFADIPWTKVVSVDKCILNLDTSSQVNVGFGSSPKVKVQRVTESWSEGSSSSPSSGNATVYPGPSMTSSGAVTKSITESENAAVSIDITAIARAWFGGSSQHGVGIISAGEDSTTYTTEFWSRENSTSSKRPSLSLTVTVED